MTANPWLAAGGVGAVGFVVVAGSAVPWAVAEGELRDAEARLHALRERYCLAALAVRDRCCPEDFSPALVEEPSC